MNYEKRNENELSKQSKCRKEISLSEKKVKVKIDSEARGYYPFSLLTITLLFGFLLLMIDDKQTQILIYFRLNYWYILAIVIASEFILYQIIFPKEWIEIIRLDRKEWIFNYYLNDKINHQEHITKVTFWWNYAFKDNRKSSEEVILRGGNSGLDGRGIANGLYLYVKLENQSGSFILLHEKLGNWASTPHWNYSLEKAEKCEFFFPCFNLKKIVKKIKN